MTYPASRDAAAASTPPFAVIIAVLAATGIVVALAQTLVVPLIGALPALLNASVSDASWVITITLLAGAISTPIGGRLADMYGKKRIMMLGTIPFIAGSILCALAGDVWTMIVGRGLQGLGTCLIPLGISLLHDILPRDKVAGAIALMSSTLGIGGALGLPIAAAVAEYTNWRILFWVIAAAGALLCLAIGMLIPARESARKTAPFDGVGALGLGVALACLLLFVSKGAEWGWTSGLALGLLVVGAAVLLAWGFYEIRHDAPLVDLRTTAQPVVLLTNLASILIGFAMYAQSLIIPQLLQLPVSTGYGHGQTMVQMGLWMAPMGLGMMAVSSLGARITERRGPKVTLVSGALVMALGYGCSTLAMGTPVGLMVTAFISACGTGLAFGAMPALILGQVPADEKAAANAFNALMRSLGTTIAAAVIGVLLGQMSQVIDGHVIPSRTGFMVALLAGCGVALVAALIAATIPARARDGARG